MHAHPGGRVCVTEEMQSNAELGALPVLEDGDKFCDYVISVASRLS